MVSDLRGLATPTKVITAAFSVLLLMLSFFAGNFFMRVSSNDADFQAALVRLDQAKVDKTTFEKQCDLNRQELEKKADRDKVDIVQRRLDQIIAIMLDPAKKEAVRAEIHAEKRK